MKTLGLALIIFMLFLSSIAQKIDPRNTGNAPINFYGRVVDQSDQPIAGVKVEVDVVTGYLKAANEIGQKVDVISLLSDSEGRFVLDNTNGMSIQFSSITKEGYKLSPKQVKRS